MYMKREVSLAQLFSARPNIKKENFNNLIEKIGKGYKE